MSWRRTSLVVGVEAIVCTIVVLTLASLSQAQVMSSGSFQIDSDSINFGGGYGSSTNYQQESTFGEIASGDSSSTNFNLRAGYQQMLTSYLSMSDVANVPLSPALGLVGGTSTGQASFLVTTDNRAGYRLTLEASNNPAMQSPNGTIANYVPSVGSPDFVFTTTVTQAHFAFSPEGVDVASRFRDNGSLCGVGGGETADACWDMVSTTPVEIVRRTSANHPSGATTTLKFRVGIGAAASVTAGIYTATSTVTAITL
jgi:hypothetical protein